jgi:hypothetical protein
MYATATGVNFKWGKAFSECFQKDVRQPIASVSLKSALGEWIEFYPLVDTGAIVSIFNKTDCDVLGYELECGTRCEIKSASGHPLLCYVHSVNMKIGEGDPINVRIAFSTSDNMGKGYLGRVDVFDNFEVDFRGKTQDTYFARDI